MERPLNWLVIGRGRAGRARVRDIEAAPDHQLVAALSGRGLHPALNDPSVDAVIVASANESHGAWAAASLRAGKHTLVEFPLCASAAEAGALYDLASSSGKVLHVELIGLLAAGFKRLRKDMTLPATRLQSTFSGGLERWVGDEMATGHLGQLAVGRLHALWQLAGPLRLVAARAHSSEGGYRLEVTMAGRGGAEVGLVESRSPGAKRGSTLVATLADGTTVERGPPSAGEALFAADLAACADRIRSPQGRGAYVSDDEVVQVLALAEAISLEVGRGGPVA